MQKIDLQKITVLTITHVLNVDISDGEGEAAFVFASLRISLFFS